MAQPDPRAGGDPDHRHRRGDRRRAARRLQLAVPIPVRAGGRLGDPVGSGDVGRCVRVDRPSAGLPSASPSEGASSSPSPSPSPTPPPAPLAQIVYADLKLDANADPGRQIRIFTFKTDGPATVTARLKLKSPKGTTRMCLTVGSSAPLCRSWASGTLTGITSSKKQTSFKVTLIGTGTFTPTVDLTLTFRAKAPSVSLQNARFDGTAPDAADFNGVSARVKIRADGSLAIKADWGGHAFDYTFDLIDLTEPTAGGSFPGNGTGIDRTDPVVASHQYSFRIANAETGFGRTGLSLVVSWP